jgi:mannose-6-phosphate isomerase-like protein (cupin superfamily)
VAEWPPTLAAAAPSSSEEQPMSVIDREIWARAPDRWSGMVEGQPHGSGISIIFNYTEAAGRGPRLHRHPYPETFIVRAGRALFTVGESEVEAHAGQILVVPAGTPHAFRNLGPGPLESINIHENATFVTEWLE